MAGLALAQIVLRVGGYPEGSKYPNKESVAQTEMRIPPNIDAEHSLHIGTWTRRVGAAGRYAYI